MMLKKEEKTKLVIKITQESNERRKINSFWHNTWRFLTREINFWLLFLALSLGSITSGYIVIATNGSLRNLLYLINLPTFVDAFSLASLQLGIDLIIIGIALVILVLMFKLNDNYDLYMILTAFIPKITVGMLTKDNIIDLIIVTTWFWYTLFLIIKALRKWILSKYQ